MALETDVLAGFRVDTSVCRVEWLAPVEAKTGTLDEVGISLEPVRHRYRIGQLGQSSIRLSRMGFIS